VTVSSAAQSVLGCLPNDAFLEDVVGETLAKFWEQAKQFLHLENFGLTVCNLILGPADDQVQPIVYQEEAIGRLQAMQEEHQEVVIKLRAQGSSTTWVQDLVLKGSDGASSLAASLSSAVDLIEGRINTVATNRVC
jgi:hypothetical protein